MSPWKLMLLPFLECLVLVGIHSYLGIHVIKRKVIFVDLALAQIAALGTIVAFVFGLAPHTTGAYVFSLLFTFIGAAVFSLTRLREERIPQEAVIGLVYALAAAVAILVVDRAPHGAEHIKEILTGSILWVRWETVLTAAVVYLGVGIFHYVFRDKFLAISNDPEAVYRAGGSVRLWDFLFYMSFGLVITHSVQTAGVLLVFVFLVVPAIMALLLTDRLLHQLLIGWAAGTLVSFAGLAISYVYDFPSGPTVVAVYGLALLLTALALYVVRGPNKGLAIARIGGGLAMTVGVACGFYLLGHWFADHAESPDGLHHGHHHGVIAQPDDGVDDEHRWGEVEKALIKRLARRDIIGKEELLASQTDVELLRRLVEVCKDDELRMAVAERIMKLDRASGRGALLGLMEGSEVPLFRDAALEMLKKESGDDFGFDPIEDPSTEANRAALDRWREWLRRSAGER